VLKNQIKIRFIFKYVFYKFNFISFLQCLQWVGKITQCNYIFKGVRELPSVSCPLLQILVSATACGICKCVQWGGGFQPGHGNYGGTELLTHTIKLIEKEKNK